MNVFSEVPVVGHDGECFVALATMFGDSADAIEAPVLVAGRQIDIPEIQRANNTREPKNNDTTRDEYLPPMLLEDFCQKTSLTKVAIPPFRLMVSRSAPFFLPRGLTSSQCDHQTLAPAGTRKTGSQPREP